MKPRIAFLRRRSRDGPSGGGGGGSGGSVVLADDAIEVASLRLSAVQQMSGGTRGGLGVMGGRWPVSFPSKNTDPRILGETGWYGK